MRLPRTFLHAMALSGLALSSTGCYSAMTHIDETIYGCQIHCQAKAAWRVSKPCYEHVDKRLDFRNGFIAGYESIARGGDGCQPVLPPPCYRKPCYMSPEGRCRTVAWFDGYSHGTVAAARDGIGTYSEVVVSPQYCNAVENAKMETEYQPASGGSPTPAQPVPELMIPEVVLPEVPDRGAGSPEASVGRASI